MSQLSNQPLQPSDSPPLQPQDEGGPSAQRKRPRIKQPWHGSLQPDARALVILLQVGKLEPSGPEITFQGCFEGLNMEQYFGFLPVEESRGHNRWLSDPVQSLSRDQRTIYIAETVRRILDFLQM
jgi:hypothetical protein